MQKEMNSNQFMEMYKNVNLNMRGIILDKLGCVMLDVDGSGIKKLEDESVLYTTKNPDRFWIKGFVAGKTPHVTLLYGLLQSANTVWRKEVDEVLKGYVINSVLVDHVDFFESPYPDDPYYCIIAHVAITDILKEGHERLSFLPHIDTYPEYKAHISIAYVKHDDLVRDEVIEYYNKMLSNTVMNVTGINYGK